ncbi:MAG: adenine phosphoribosyltransferase [Alphaproteobacteria bacterium]|nr:adenine phosphoribosyltransferase [Alphaproteobacteria bacterium]
MNLKKYICSVPDFPKPGILFYDISTLIVDPVGWRQAMDAMKEVLKKHKPDVLMGIESRGFLIAAPMALELGIGFSMIRKKGKLPGEVVSYEYDLEYGTDIIEIQKKAVKKGQRVVIVDDLLATGGTMAASVELVRSVGGDVVGAAGIIELTFLGGRQKLAELGANYEALVSYDE